jgi:hypothetical protein
VRHYEPPEVAWLPPELALGEEPELKPPELELDEPELVELEPLELEPLELEPEPELEPLVPEVPEPELAPEPELELVPEPELMPEPELELVCADPGRARARAPAVTTLATVTVVVVERTLARPRSLAATARRIPSFRRSLLISSSCGPVLGNPCTNLLGQL